VPDPDPDPTPTPDPDYVDIPEEKVPTSEFVPSDDDNTADVHTDDVPLTDLPQEDVPLADTPSSEPDQDTLPQTGVAWWPAGLLAALGIGLAATGLWVDRKRINSTPRNQNRR
jgi:LPXTG-motif cell wall-anchored protein